MWWNDITGLGDRLATLLPEDGLFIDPSAEVEPGAILDTSGGPIRIGARSKVCAGAVLKGPISLGDECLVGNNSMLRGPIITGDAVRIGFTVELKQALLGDRVSIGPMCFVADSRVDDDSYLGAMVRTSNQRLDRAPIDVRDGEQIVKTGCEKLGCWVGAGASLGIQVIILPGRVVAAGAMFEPRVTITHNLPAGQYRLSQQIEKVGPKESLS
jgi:UDP-N-acetylglucosamine diphosphorylase / glucose-1-phosphate thymidylyltransferase / UDP-N-acetylgalactosamine diphosphorylase / glucosamine-1-phosphate N-acetyltransferase / galactosamine-1-phosphate N-acetyltransferase